MRIWIRMGLRFGIGMVALTASLAGCQPDVAGEPETPAVIVPAKLPAMSGGTLQELQAHTFSSTLVTRYTSDTASRREERQILLWQDMQNYRYEVWQDENLQSLEYRQGEYMLRRRGNGDYHFAHPSAGSQMLAKTMIPCDVTLAKFSAGLQVEEIPLPKEDQDPDGKERRLYTLALRTASSDESTELQHQQLLAQGYSGIPVTMDGHALVDGLGNRLRVEFEGSYLKRKSGTLEEEPTLVTMTMSRVLAPDGLDLHPPAEAAVLFFEKQEESRKAAP